ncbi:MFS/sugar transport protein [Carpediemonas membranifera]|uniref:MFS/sugar transport protein n=1 Tax=Carpediemonas membranifera TaxID=201153 RepID=A0A8J6AZA3_9EUKA|nr:MFS/sugar transport protein [Carpediemonas membranifera]|eukprot:KAG9395055.1 MFS/sugar transport protein [Carpediemonas membranifera]
MESVQESPIGPLIQDNSDTEGGDTIDASSDGPRQLSLLRKIMFACGEFGWSLTAFSVSTLVSYFYMPPVQDGTAKFSTFISQHGFLIIFTSVGLINAVARVFDAVTDPLVAGLSDRSNFRLGKRKTFMIAAIVPFSLSSVFAFIPLVGHESVINAVWLLALMVVFYWSMTCYVAPYSALLPEVGHTIAERLNMSTMLAIAWALGYGGGNCIYLTSAAVGALGLSNVHAFQVGVALNALVGFIAMLMPILAVREGVHTVHMPAKENIFTSFLTAMANGPFRVFGVCVCTFFLVQTFMTSGMVYYVTVLYDASSLWATLLMAVVFIIAFLLQAPINYVAHKLGRKILMVTGFALLSVDFLMLAALTHVPVLSTVQLALIIVTIAYPISVFLMLPNAIISEIAVADAIETGREGKSGMFFAAKTFSNKVGISAANLIFPSLLLLGKSSAHPFGVRAIALTGSGASVVGVVISLFFREGHITRVIREHQSRVEQAGVDEEQTTLL